MILLPCERCSNLKRNGDRRYGGTVMTGPDCQRLRSSHRSERDLIARSCTLDFNSRYTLPEPTTGRNMLTSFGQM